MRHDAGVNLSAERPRLHYRIGSPSPLSAACASGLCALALFSFGCGGEATSSEDEFVVAAPVDPAAVREPGPPPIFGEDGELLASEESVAGLVLPRGCTATLEEGRRHVYAVRAPMARVQAYFGPRLYTTHVEERGPTLVYLDAVPNDAAGAAVHMDVFISPSSAGGVRVEVRELPPEVATAPPEAETIERITAIIEASD